MCPVAWRLIAAEPRSSGEIVCHCLLIETGRGLVLVDTGYGLGDIAEPARLGWLLRVSRPRLDPAETALRQVEALGFEADEVRDIIVTHLDVDHAGGLGDFPSAKVHLLRAERDGSDRATGLLAPVRYRPKQWAHGPDWVTYEPGGGEAWNGFEAVRDLQGLPPEILLVPLTGHSPGHTAVAVEMNGGWLLHCGDAYFHRAEVDPSLPRGPRGADLFGRSASVDESARRWNVRRLKTLRRERGDSVRVFCAHDPEELNAARG